MRIAVLKCFFFISIHIGWSQTWVKVSAGSNCSLGIKSDGTLWFWGRNNYGEYGDESFNESLVPIQIGTQENWTDIACGGIHVLALKSDSTIWYVNNKLKATNIDQLVFKTNDTFYVTKIDTNGCTKTTDVIKILKFSTPTTPTISRDTSNSLVSNATIGNVWYKDGAAIDTTQKIKPSAAGSYTVKTTQNGCVSALSSPYYYLVTDVINLSKDEFIKLAPNPFINQLNFDFVVKGYQRLNL